MSKLILYARRNNMCPACHVAKSQLNEYHINYDIVYDVSPTGLLPSLEYGDDVSVDLNVIPFLTKLYEQGHTELFQDIPQWEKIMKKYKGD